MVADNYSTCQKIEKLKLTIVIEQLRQLAVVAKNNLLYDDFKTIKEYYPETFIWRIYEAYSALSLFPDEQIIERFEELGIKRNYLNWFIPVEDIVKPLEKLEIGEGMLFLKHQAFIAIKFHMEIQMAIDLMIWAGLFIQVGNDKITNLAHTLDKIRRRKKDNGGDPKTFKNEYEFLLNDLINEYSQTIDNNDPLGNTLINLTKGHTTKFFLRDIIDNCICYSNNAERNNRKLCTAFSGLFLLLIKNEQWMTKEQFEKQQLYGGKSHKNYIITRIMKNFGYV